MKRILTLAIATALAATVLAPASADAAPKPKHYKNCTAMHKVYPGGVKRTAGAKNKGGKLHYRQVVSKKVYDLNKGSDRDHDKLVCER